MALARPVTPLRHHREGGVKDREGNPFAGRWRDGSVVCLASGPSLTTADVETVRRWREATGTAPKGVIVVNTTFRLAPWADALFAMDLAWWKEYNDEVRQNFLGAKYTVNNFDKVVGVVQVAKPFTAHGNSGAGAVAMAAKGGASRVLLVGYDCQHTGGKRHWHGNHPKGLGNADVVAKWPNQFQKMKEHLPTGVEVINCSRQTALTIFPRMDLGDALAERQ